MELETPAPVVPHVISPPRLIIKNIVSLGTRGLLDRAFALLGGIFARRALGPAPIGAFSWSAAIASYPALFVNSGFGTIARRDLARAPQQATRYVGLVLSIQFLLALVASAILGVLALTVDQPNATRWLLGLQIIGILLVPFDLSWVLMAIERNAPLAGVNGVLGLIRTACIILFVRNPADVFLYAIIAYPFQIVATVFIVFYTSRIGAVQWLDVRPTLRGAATLFKESLPIGLTSATALIYYNSDVIILGTSQTARQVGLYATAYGLMLTAVVFAGAIANAYLPSLSRAAGNPRLARDISTQYLKVLVWLGFTFAGLGWAIGRNVVVLLYGAEFTLAGEYFEFLCLNLAVLFFNTGYALPLQVWGGQKQLFYATLVAAIFNVAANLILLPRFGVPAAIVTTILSEVLVAGIMSRLRRTFYPISWIKPVLTAMVITTIGAVSARVLADMGWWIVGAMIGVTIIAAGLGCFERRTIRAVASRLAK